MDAYSLPICLLACAFSGLFSRLLHTLSLLLSLLSLPSSTKPSLSSFSLASQKHTKKKKSSSRVRETTHRRNATTLGGRPANQHSTVIRFHTAGAFPYKDPTVWFRPGEIRRTLSEVWVAGPNHTVGTRLPAQDHLTLDVIPSSRLSPLWRCPFSFSKTLLSHRQHNLPTLARSGPGMPSKDHNAFHCFPRPVPGAQQKPGNTIHIVK